jgi:hypothetical protein
MTGERVFRKPFTPIPGLRNSFQSQLARPNSPLSGEPLIARLMVDAALLHKINPNYSRPRIIEPVKQESTDIGYLF